MIKWKRYNKTDLKSECETYDIINWNDVVVLYNNTSSIYGCYKDNTKVYCLR
jgi:hypothetical protein